MKEKLPKVFANKINKKIENNKKVFISKKEETDNTQSKPPQKSINKKISEILNNKKYIYKIPVKIKTTTEEVTTIIIGRNSKNLITNDNKLIKIDSIIDIKINEKNELTK